VDTETRTCRLAHRDILTNSDNIPNTMSWAGADPGGAPPLFLAKLILFSSLYTMSEKNMFEIEFGFYSGRNPRSFWKCGGCMRVCVCESKLWPLLFFVLQRPNFE